VEQGGGETMRRVGNLWGELTSFGNLLGAAEAAEAAAAGKRKRPDVGDLGGSVPGPGGTSRADADD
jgi:hypothetical protein